MYKSNQSLMAEARESLQGKWGRAAVITLVYMVIGAGAGSIPRIGWIASLIISGPLVVGLAKIFLALSRGKQVELGNLFDGFTIFSKSLTAYLLIALYVILWSLLLIIPGIVAAISYSMTYFIILDQPDSSASEALEKSKAMMQGNKMRFFLLGCRFIGWFLVGILTAGIGFLWIVPYFMTSQAKFYQDLLDDKQK